MGMWDEPAPDPAALDPGVLVWVQVGEVWYRIVLTQPPTPAVGGGVILWGVEDPEGAVSV